MKTHLSTIFKDFTGSEKNAGIILIMCAVLSLVITNTGFSEPYLHFWHQHIGFRFLGFDMNLSIEHWINDGIMTVFFLMVGLEIERELYNGELNPIKNALLPIAGAIGGMLVPAVIFLGINYNRSTASGFGIPMGTDIAFALAVIALAGKKVPVSVKVMLTAIAIIDDLGSILIIAFFYGSDINGLYLLIALGVFGLLILLNRLNMHHILPYMLLGIAMWFFMMQSGIHPTISGVLLAFAYPFGDGSENSPSIKLQRKLHLPVAFIILPLFTLANTAIPLKSEYISNLNSTHAFGIALGLIIGKPLGIALTLWALVKTKLVSLPEHLTWYHILSMGCVAGIGFTMSIFITQLAFTDEVTIQSSKMMILIASCIAGILGYFMFTLKRKPTEGLTEIQTI